jgi:hypothetical protein
MIWLRVDDPARVDPSMREIDDTFHNSGGSTRLRDREELLPEQFQALEGSRC